MSMMKKKGSGFGSISQRHGFADTDPDPHQNVMDPQHCIKTTNFIQAILGKAVAQQDQVSSKKYSSHGPVPLSNVMRD
jgi:hypothetical protein